jgi:hypothetical protein
MGIPSDLLGCQYDRVKQYARGIRTRDLQPEERVRGIKCQESCEKGLRNNEKQKKIPNKGILWVMIRLLNM